MAIYRIKTVLLVLLAIFQTSLYAQTAVISGKVTDGTSPLVVKVVATQIGVLAPNAMVAETTTNAEGNYIFDKLNEGSYYIAASGIESAGTDVYIAEHFSSASCVGEPCSGVITAVNAANAAPQAGINFILGKGAVLIGKVTHRDIIIPNIKVEVRSKSGVSVTSAKTNKFGDYRIVGISPATQYQLATANSYGYINFLFGYGDCLGTTCTKEAKINKAYIPAFTSGEVRTVNFALKSNSLFSGVVIDRVTRLPIENASVTRSVYDAAGVMKSSQVARTNVQGYYQFASTTAGVYKIRTSATGYHINVYGCVGSCTSASGSNIAVASGVPTVLNLELEPRSECNNYKDKDADGVLDCYDECTADATKSEAGFCGCGVPDVDTNENGIADCLSVNEVRNGLTSFYEQLSNIKKGSSRNENKLAVSKLREEFANLKAFSVAAQKSSVKAKAVHEYFKNGTLKSKLAEFYKAILKDQKSFALVKKGVQKLLAEISKKAARM